MDEPSTTDQLLTLLSQLLTERMRLRDLRRQMEQHDAQAHHSAKELERLLAELLPSLPPRPLSVVRGGLAQMPKADDADSS